MYRPRMETDDRAACHHDRRPGGPCGAPGPRRRRPSRCPAAPGAWPSGTARSPPRRRARAGWRWSGAVVGNVTTGASSASSASPAPHAEDRRHQRDRGRDQRAEHDQQQHQRAGQADDLGLQVAGRLPDLARAGAVLDLQARLAWPGPPRCSACPGRWCPASPGSRSSATLA